MNDLHAWLSQQHHGLRTFKILQQKLGTLSEDEPEQRALCRLLSCLVGSYVEAFDEEPLPVALRVARRRAVREGQEHKHSARQRSRW